MNRDQLKRLKELEICGGSANGPVDRLPDDRNQRLRRAVSDLTLDKMILTEAARGDVRPNGPEAENARTLKPHHSGGGTQGCCLTMAALRHALPPRSPAPDAGLNIAVVSLPGGVRIRKDRTAASPWLRKFGVPVSVCRADERKPEQVSLSDMPQPERLACLVRRAETMGLPMGAQDDAAHLALAAKPVTAQNTAYAAPKP